MELILKYIYNTLETIPDQRVELLFLATQRLEVCACTSCPYRLA